MSSHAGTITADYDPRKYEEQMNREHLPLTPKEWGGPDTTANLRNREANLKKTDALCERLAAAARERGRPLTATEISLVGEGKPLPPITVAKAAKDRIAELEARVAELEKQSVAPHMRQVEKRG